MPATTKSVRADSSGSSHADCAISITASTPPAAHQWRARPVDRITIRNTINATSSARFSAWNTARLTSSAMGRVALAAENRAGVATRDMPAVMPNQVKHTQAGLVAAAFR